MAKRKKVTSRQVPLLDVFNLQGATPEEICESEQFSTFLYTITPQAIEEAIRTRKQVATLFQIHGKEVVVEIEKEDWSKAIDQCIEYQSRKEEYELCSELRDIKSKIPKSKKELI